MHMLLLLLKGRYDTRISTNQVQIHQEPSPCTITIKKRRVQTLGPVIMTLRDGLPGFATDFRPGFGTIFMGTYREERQENCNKSQKTDTHPYVRHKLGQIRLSRSIADFFQCWILRLLHVLLRLFVVFLSLGRRRRRHWR